MFSHPGEMCAHREVLNAPLLPRSCAKCCFGCIPAIDRSLAAGGEMAAGRDCASFNEFIQLYSSSNGLWIHHLSQYKEEKKILSLLYLGPHGQPAVLATLHASTAYRVYFVCTLTLMTPGFVHKSCQLCSVLKCPWCCIVLVRICLLLCSAK